MRSQRRRRRHVPSFGGGGGGGGGAENDANRPGVGAHRSSARYGAAAGGGPRDGGGAVPSAPSLVGVVDYRAPFEAIAVAHERREREKIDAMRPRDPLWFLDDPYEMSSSSLAAKRRVSGRDRLRRFDSALDAFDRHLRETERTTGRSPDQRW